MQNVFFDTAKTFLLDLLFPVECFGCGIAGTYLCAPCFAKLPLQELFICPVCEKPSFEHAVCVECTKRTKLDGLIAASFYDIALLRRLIFAYKYKFVKPLALPLSQLIVKCLTLHNHSLFHRNDLVLVPVPLSKRRERWRGFNQAREIAVLLGKALQISLCDNALFRTRNTVPQIEAVSRKERFENIRGAFKVADPLQIKNKTILLVDDVATSLATLNECARVLKGAGAKEVWGIVVAREYVKKEN
ncbi:MAG: ComF family protein [bacterium]|nr:ComF family protein [bacterium]